MAEVRHAAVLGHPVAHSLSPRLHRAAYRALGLDGWTYAAVDITQDQLPAFVATVDGSWVGLSVTMPLKQAIIPLLDHIEPLAGVVGAVNTVLVQAGGSRPVLTGANTDVHGLVAALSEQLTTPDEADGSRTAAIIGAGATAASALAALAELGCPTPVVYVRALGRVGQLARAAHRMGVEPVFRPLTEAVDGIGRADLVVSTLPSHAADDLAVDLAAGSGEGTRPGAVLIDVAYDPRRTALAAAWEARGGATVAGERMLLHQAVEQVRLMTGHPAPLAAMDAALDHAFDGSPAPA